MSNRTSHLIRSHGCYTSLRPYLRDCEKYAASHPFNAQRALNTNVMLLPANLSVDSRTNLHWEFHATSSEVFKLRSRVEPDGSEYFHRLKQAQLYQQQRRQNGHHQLHLPHVYAYHHHQPSHHNHHHHHHAQHSQHSHHHIHPIYPVHHHSHHPPSSHHSQQFNQHAHYPLHYYKVFGPKVKSRSTETSRKPSEAKKAFTQPLLEVLPPLIQAVSQNAVYRPVAEMFDEVHVESDKLLHGPQKAQRGQRPTGYGDVLKGFPNPNTGPLKISDYEIVFGQSKLLNLPAPAPGWERSRIQWLWDLERIQELRQGNDNDNASKRAHPAKEGKLWHSH